MHAAFLLSSHKPISDSFPHFKHHTTTGFTLAHHINLQQIHLQHLPPTKHKESGIFKDYTSPTI